MTLQERGGPCSQDRTGRVATGSGGAVVETCTSLPFGDWQSCTRSASARFAGYDTDNEYGLAHAPARYYSPSLGRFMTPDPFGTPPAGGTCSAGGGPSDAMTSPLAHPESLNRCAYVVDSPATLADPSGNFILAADCFLDSGLPECQCDPENGCPPDLLLLLPPLGLGTAAPSSRCFAYLQKDSTPRVVLCGTVFKGSVQLRNSFDAPPPATGDPKWQVFTSGGVSIITSPPSVSASSIFDFQMSFTASGSGTIRWVVDYTCGGSRFRAVKGDPVTCGSGI